MTAGLEVIIQKQCTSLMGDGSDYRDAMIGGKSILLVKFGVNKSRKLVRRSTWFINDTKVSQYNVTNSILQEKKTYFRFSTNEWQNSIILFQCLGKIILLSL